MSKLYKNYKLLKEKEDKIYLFKVGIFCIFIDDDAIFISEKLNLKCTHLNDTILKCGFPLNSIEKYIKKLTELNINYEIIDENYINDQEEIKLNKLNKFINKLKKENINNIDGLKAISLIYELRGIVDGN